MINRLKKFIERLTGYWIWKRIHLPTGTDLEVDLEKINLSGSKIVFDVGANIGQTALYYNKIFKSAHIYSFEPVKKSFEELLYRTKNLPKIQAENIGFGEKDEKIEITLDINPTSTSNSLKPELMNNDQNGGKEVLKICKIDSFCKERNIDNIDFLKIDTEGWEIQTLLGAEKLLSERNIKAILCEVGFTKENRRNTPFQDLNSFMADKGYFFYGLYDISLIQLKSGGHYGNALFVDNKYLMKSIH